MLTTLLLDPYTELTQINSWLYPNNNLLHYVYLVFQRENAAGVVLLLLQVAVISTYCIRGNLCHRSLESSK